MIDAKNINRLKAKFQVIVSIEDLSQEHVIQFRKMIYEYYTKYGRDLPWRNINDPYKILVSEIMLQQTQVERVINKYNDFVKLFPDISSLSNASTQDILSAWHGLGYNRRALALKKCAELIEEKHNGHVPRSFADLLELPGLGKATAASVAVFAFNAPLVFIETNIRTVYFYFFFCKREKITDREIEPFLEKTLDTENPAEWYSALMDYGVMLKKNVANNDKSSHYRKQLPFKGSSRELRGKIVHFLLNHPIASVEDLALFTGNGEKRITIILQALVKEGFLIKHKDYYSITP